MSKFSICVLAFSAGFVCATLLFKPASVPVLAAGQSIEPSIEGRSVFDGTLFSNGKGFKIEGAVPQFLPIDQTPVFENVTISNDIPLPQSIDGLDCRGCDFENVRLTYGGGAFNLENPRFSGTTTLTLTGAAANTVAFLKLMEQVGNGLPGLPNDVLRPHTPVKRRFTAKKPMKHMTVTAPYIGN